MRSIGILSHNEIFRTLFKFYFEFVDQFKVIVEASTEQVFLKNLVQSTTLPDLVIIDGDIPMLAEIIIDIKKSWSSIKCLVLTPYTHRHLISDMLSAGADGIVSKSGSLDEILYSVSEILKGEKIVVSKSGKIAQTSLDNVESIVNENVKLTVRQKHFLQLCAVPELTYKDIASKMNISLKTVDRYRDDLFKKLQICSRTGLAIYAFQTGLADFF